MEQVFPFMGVRFIAVNDNYDSSSHNGSIVGIDTGFKALMYDFYSKDISAKVKTSLANKFSRGEYAYGQVPFGYQKSSTVKNGVEVSRGCALYFCTCSTGQKQCTDCKTAL